jgi:hypothetical protein
MGIVHYPYDLASNPEHQHVFYLRIYSNESASLSNSSRSADQSTDANVSAEIQKISGGNFRMGKTQGEAASQPRHYMADKESGGDQEYVQTSYNSSAIRNKDSVALPFPQEIAIGNGWEWETTSFQRTALAEALTGNWAIAAERLSADISGGIGKIAVENADKLVQHHFKRVANPRKESMFKEPTQRSFSFSWKFAPRNQDDSDNIQQIISLLKYHASPATYGDDHSLFQYPSEFQPFFLSNAEENPYIGKIARCALTNVKVNYADAGIWSAFNRTNAPTHLSMELEFKELSLLSRQDLKRMDTT